MRTLMRVVQRISTGALVGGAPLDVSAEQLVNDLHGVGRLQHNEWAALQREARIDPLDGEAEGLRVLVVAVDASLTDEEFDAAIEATPVLDGEDALAGVPIVDASGAVVAVDVGEAFDDAMHSTEDE